MKTLLKKFWEDEQGLELSEYAVMAALVILIAVGAITVLGNTIDKIFSDLNGAIAGTTTP